MYSSLRIFIKYNIKSSSPHQKSYSNTENPTDFFLLYPRLRQSKTHTQPRHHTRWILLLYNSSYLGVHYGETTAKLSSLIERAYIDNYSDVSYSYSGREESGESEFQSNSCQTLGWKPSMMEVDKNHVFHIWRE